MSFIQQIQPIQVTYSSFRELGLLYLPGNRQFGLSYQVCWHSCPIPIRPSVCTVQQRRHPAFIPDVGFVFCISLLFVPSFRSLPFSPHLLSSVFLSLPLPVYHLQRHFVLHYYCCCCVCDVVCVMWCVCVQAHAHYSTGQLLGTRSFFLPQVAEIKLRLSGLHPFAISPFLMIFFGSHYCFQIFMLVPSSLLSFPVLLKLRKG